MRIKVKILSAVATALACVSAFAAQPQPQNTFSVGATNNGTAVAWCTISANSANGGVPVLTAINAGTATTIPTFTSVSNFAGAVIAWRIVDKAVANFTNGTTSVPVAATNSFVSGDLVLVRHMLDDNYERASLTTATSGTNLTFNAAPAEAIIPGDIIYRLSATNAAYVVQWNNATNTLTGNRILVGQKGLPLHLSLTSSGSTSAILNASGYYEVDKPTSPLTP